MAPSLRWDIFCRVVDNFGDAGICWRLARQLALERGLAVTLWIDDVATLARMAPSVAANADDQLVDHVHICRLDGSMTPLPQLPDVVIEGFGCGLPEAYLASMAAAPVPPVWVVLEYLSAEPWIDATHALPSPHPRTGLARWFWFPGFTERSGGLLREEDVSCSQRAHAATAPHAAVAANERGEETARRLDVSLFCYPNPALPALFTAWAEGDDRVNCMVPVGVASAAIARWSGDTTAHAGTVSTRGNLTVAIVPFVDQREYDRQLRGSDLNLVRGEDSFVRAQWASKPCVWHAYPQVDDAHLAKMSAFLLRYEHSIPPAARAAQRAFWYAWNDGSGVAVATAWPAFRASLPVLATRAHDWALCLAAQPDLVTRLVSFCETRL